MSQLATPACAARITSARSRVPEACPESRGTHAASMNSAHGLYRTTTDPSRISASTCFANFGQLTMPCSRASGPFRGLDAPFAQVASLSISQGQVNHAIALRNHLRAVAGFNSLSSAIDGPYCLNQANQVMTSPTLLCPQIPTHLLSSDSTPFAPQRQRGHALGRAARHAPPRPGVLAIQPSAPALAPAQGSRPTLPSSPFDPMVSASPGLLGWLGGVSDCLSFRHGIVRSGIRRRLPDCPDRVGALETEAPADSSRTGFSSWPGEISEN